MEQLVCAQHRTLNRAAGGRLNQTPRNNAPKVIKPQAMVISQKLEIGSATAAMPNTGKSANTPQMTDIRKMIKDGAVSRMVVPFCILFGSIMPRPQCNGQPAHSKKDTPRRVMPDFSAAYFNSRNAQEMGFAKTGWRA
jgi:hypothetical protein